MSEGFGALDGGFVDACVLMNVVCTSIYFDSADDRSVRLRWPIAPAVHEVVFDEWIFRPSIDTKKRNTRRMIMCRIGHHRMSRPRPDTLAGQIIAVFVIPFCREPPRCICHASFCPVSPNFICEAAVLGGLKIGTNRLLGLLAGWGPDRSERDRCCLRHTLRLGWALVKKLAFLCGCMVKVALAPGPGIATCLRCRALTLPLAVGLSRILFPIDGLAHEGCVRYLRNTLRFGYALVEKLAFFGGWIKAIALALPC